MSGEGDVVFGLTRHPYTFDAMKLHNVTCGYFQRSKETEVIDQDAAAEWAQFHPAAVCLQCIDHTVRRHLRAASRGVGATTDRPGPTSQPPSVSRERLSRVSRHVGSTPLGPDGTR